MTKHPQVRRAGTCALTIAAAMGLSVPAAMAAPPEESPRASGPGPTFTFPLDAGQACEFALEVSGTGGVRATPPREGGTVISAGRGSQLTFTNLDDTTQTLSLRSNGSVSRTTPINEDVDLVQATGHNVVILFPTDVPAGPSTTLFVGRVVYTDQGGFFTVLSHSGRTVDICAALES